MVMKLYLKLMLAVVGVTSFSLALLGADAAIPYGNYNTNAYAAPRTYAAPISSASLSSNAVMSALNAQASLLKELIQEHQGRAADSTQKNQAEKAKWETDLVTELQQKGAQVQKNIDQVTQSSAGTNALKAGAGNVDDQLAFVSTLEARLEQVGQELSAAIEDSRVLASQIGTNKVPEDFAAMSQVLDQNQRVVRDLQKEHFDLELRRLEYRAMLRVLQK
jgi:hypothetical protein